MNIRIEITKDGGWKEYPYRVRAFEDNYNIILFEDDFMKDIEIGKLYEQIKRQIETGELR